MFMMPNIVIGPKRPRNINNDRMIFDAGINNGVIPIERPTVPKALKVSNNIVRKFTSGLGLLASILVRITKMTMIDVKAKPAKVNAFVLDSDPILRLLMMVGFPLRKLTIERNMI